MNEWFDSSDNPARISGLNYLYIVHGDVDKGKERPSSFK